MYIPSGPLNMMVSSPYVSIFWLPASRSKLTAQRIDEHGGALVFPILLCTNPEGVYLNSLNSNDRNRKKLSNRCMTRSCFAENRIPNIGTQVHHNNATVISVVLLLDPKKLNIVVHLLMQTSLHPYQAGFHPKHHLAIRVLMQSLAR